MIENKFSPNELYFCYEDTVTNSYIVGKRGNREFKVNRWDFERHYDRQRRKISRELNLEEIYKMCLIESQYVDFEEVENRSLITGKTF
jgi:hypothetical protein